MFRKAILVFMICVYSTIIPNNAGANTEEDARKFVDDIGKNVLDTINDSGKSEEQKRTTLRQMFLDNVDIPWMGQFVLGVGWRQATEEQRTRYLKAYQEYMVAHYTSNFSDYTGSKYTITGVKSEEAGSVTVNMRIKTAKQAEEARAGYSLRTNNGGFKIIDIIVEGVSLLVTQRSEFGSVMHQKGMEGLISTLEKKASQESSNTKPAKKN